VYARLSPYRGLEHTELLKGDVVFVGRHATSFGSGTDRVTRCTNIEDLNKLLQRPENSLPTGDVSLAPKLLRSRQQVKADLDVHYKAALAERNNVRARNVNQVWSRDAQHGFDRVVQTRSLARGAVVEADNGVSANAAVQVYPEFDWLAVPALREWRVDGVLYGHERDSSVVDLILPHKTAGDSLLNVCVEGPCPVRNQKLANVPQYFDDAVASGEYLYVCIVATASATAWSYTIKTASMRQLRELLGAGQRTAVAPPRPGGQSSDFTKQDAVYTVAAYRIGRVVDDRLVGGEGAHVMLDVEVVLLNRLALWRELIGDDDDDDLKAMMGRLLQMPPIPVVVVPPPPAVVPPAVIPPPVIGPVVGPGPPQGPLGPQAPQLPQLPPQPQQPQKPQQPQPPPDDDDDDDALPPRPRPKRPLALRAPGRPLVLPSPGALNIGVVEFPDAPWEQFAFSFGRGALAANRNGWLQLPRSSLTIPRASRTAPRLAFSVNWLGDDNWAFPGMTNGAVAYGVNNFIHHTVAAMPMQYQRQFFINALALTQSGFMRGLDEYMASGPSTTMTTYEDICGWFLTLNDNGLTHTLCVELNRVLPYEIMTQRDNESARIGTISFRLPPQEGSAMSLDGLIDMQQFLDRAPGSSLEEKSNYISFSLNLLFDLPINTPWETSDIGITWVRTTTDQELWDDASMSRLDLMNYVSEGSSVTGSDFTTSNFLMMLFCFGVIMLAGLSSASIGKLKEEAKQFPALPAPHTTAQSQAPTVDDMQQLPSGQLVLSKFDSFRFTKDMAMRPFMMSPAFRPGQSFLVPIPRPVEGSSPNWPAVVQVANQSRALTVAKPDQTMVSNAASGVYASLMYAVKGAATTGAIVAGGLFLGAGFLQD
jgi:hypothetical protein